MVDEKRNNTGAFWKRRSIDDKIIVTIEEYRKNHQYSPNWKPLILLQFGQLVGRNPDTRIEIPGSEPWLVYPKIDFKYFKGDIELHQWEKFNEVIDNFNERDSVEEANLRERVYLERPRNVSKKSRQFRAVQSMKNPEGRMKFVTIKIIKKIFIYNPADNYDFYVTISHKVYLNKNKSVHGAQLITELHKKVSIWHDDT
ncbi:hypothetical protein Cantr_07888 [Candida viswanathii]|uniref:mRNA 5'-phosphatase n=1 Tax=Candida viswanathii TaxID=5486 RepID=A0A367XZY1_9ASCO|nr:hypothetical protein Cantr_07888 [Candida viswanathii]